MRHKAYQHFYQAYTYLVETLEIIVYIWHIGKHIDLYSDWGTANRIEAQQILASITSFDFMEVYQYLSHLFGISTQRQSTTVDIIEAHFMVSRLLIIIYVFYIILPLIYTEVVLILLACACLCKTYANGHVPNRTVHNLVIQNIYKQQF